MTELETGVERQNAAVEERWAVTRNACKSCMPLGASLAFKGIENSISLLHGSQGCATYIRRYLISHFREPIDIASSNFTEHSAVFGGKHQLSLALDNVVKQYKPELVAIATTCLSETIGDDVPGILTAWTEQRREKGLFVPKLVHASTPSYQASHREGYQEAILSTIRSLCGETPKEKSTGRINVIPGMASTADLRWLKETVALFGLEATLFPDYSDSLEGGLWDRYHPVPPGGTPVAHIETMPASAATLELGALPLKHGSAGEYLRTAHGVPLFSLDLPVGVAASDLFYRTLSECSGRPIPRAITEARSRLADAFVDAHKVCAGMPAIVYGEEDFALALAAFAGEIGLDVKIVASGGKSGLLKNRVGGVAANARVLDDADFLTIEDVAQGMGFGATSGIIIGNGKGYKLSKQLGVPLVRCGFPVHDRFGASRILHFGYEGAIRLFDSIVNEILGTRQETDTIGYSYY